MKILIAGASGFVGRAMVPLLVAKGADVTVAGRNPAQLADLYPQCRVTGYDDFAAAARGSDLVVNLAVANSNSSLAADAVEHINVAFALELAAAAREAGVPRFLNMSSIHALDPGNQSAYAATKRMATEKLHAASAPARALKPGLRLSLPIWRRCMPGDLPDGLPCSNACLKPCRVLCSAFFRHSNRQLPSRLLPGWCMILLPENQPKAQSSLQTTRTRTGFTALSAA
ncbi:MAG: NAD(P)-dependent oxidoreductase [Phyllobacteriaceae bacterium]|nr:NAD(P)-dependent oxidoreductase [Phyllobacteriaceae bacterium]